MDDRFIKEYRTIITVLQNSLVLFCKVFDHLKCYPFVHLLAITAQKGRQYNLEIVLFGKMLGMMVGARGIRMNLVECSSLETTEL